ncbi:flagellin-sensitive 2 [Planoprotostelium fungivorum]|uniref:Flagellin-sensitive 2 n=1 Tax=Planoprotostelium fungivorum TaxID=1890364 RepID=A0A2P6MX20_9EUKA|nr:flagellin-sensitive 2 [Planoprotostelium fungivorum]
MPLELSWPSSKASARQINCAFDEFDHFVVISREQKSPVDHVLHPDRSNCPLEIPTLELLTIILHQSYEVKNDGIILVVIYNKEGILTQKYPKSKKIRATISDDIRSILMEFHDATLPAEILLDEWGTDSDPCDGWEGITCDSDGSNITGLEFPYYGLIGKIPPSFSNLTTLLVIDFYNNNFDEDMIVPDLDRMTGLYSFNLASDSMINLESWRLSRLPSSLVYLNLAYIAGANLTTADLLSLPHLSVLDLSGNPFAAAIDFEKVARVTALTSLTINNIGLTGQVPEWMFNLTTLGLDGNQMELTIPHTCRLRSLSFSNNLDQGVLPTTGNCPHLEIIDLSRNQYTGRFNSTGSDCILKELSLSSNLLTGLSDVSSCTLLRRLDLTYNQIFGPLPDVSQMDDLTILWLSDNQFSGEVSDMFSNKRSHMSIDLGTNLLFGELPSSIWERSYSLKLSTNAFTGTLPPLDNATDLRVLDVSYNNMSGVIVSLPPDMQILSLQFNQFTGDFPDVSNQLHISDWDISHNQFSGDLFDLPYCNPDVGIKVFDASHNQFTGHILSGISTCQSLIRLNLDRNQLSEDISDVTNVISEPQKGGNLPFFDIPHLRILTLDYNLFNGSLPNPLTNAMSAAIVTMSHNDFTGGIETFQNSNYQNLLTLDLSYNRFSGSPFSDTDFFIINDDDLSGLLYLDLSHNTFSAPIFTTTNVNLGLLPGNLQYMDLSYNHFYGTPSLYSDTSFSQLQTVILSNNRLGINSINAFTSIPSLKVLDLSGNPISGVIPSGLGSLASLTYLNLSSTNIGGRPSINLRRLTSLQVLDLHDNHLVGDDLSWLRGMSQLQQLDLSKNQLTASISGVIGPTALKTLDMSNNRFIGGIADFCKIKSLDQFIVSNNSLNGTVCTFISDVRTLRIDHNSFTGDASFLSSMTALQYIDISSNQLSQQLPNLNRLSKLLSANMSRNNFVGAVPDLTQLESVVSMDMSHNSFNDTAPILSDNNDQLAFFDISYNDFKWADTFYLPANVDDCSMIGMTFECPISSSARNRCGAICSATQIGATNISIKVSGDLQSFNQTRFIDVISTSLGVDSSRFYIHSLRSGSVIVDLTVYKPSPNSNEGSASTVVSQMQSPAFKTSLASSNYSLLLVDSYIPDPTFTITSPTASGVSPNAPNREGINSGTIVGIVVAIFVALIVAAVVVAVIMWRRRVKAMNQRSQIMMVDMAAMNLSPVEKSVVPYKELENMVVIGSGAFGIVFSAQWRGIKVAVKQIKAEYVDEKQVSEFLHEVAVMQNLRSHPHVVLFLGITVPPSPLSIITEYCGGGSLLSYLRKNGDAITVEQKIKFVTQIAQGMLHLHLEKIIHRDLAVRNVRISIREYPAENFQILLTTHLEAKVADFGMSRQQVDDVQTTATMIGPIRWMAPEAIRERKYSNKTDVFSFGILVWEIVTNREPYEELDTMQVAIAVMNNNLRPEIPRDTDIVLRKLMEGCWKGDPRERPNFAHICGLLGVEAPEDKDTDNIFSDDRDPYAETNLDEGSRYEPVTTEGQNRRAADHDYGNLV